MKEAILQIFQNGDIWTIIIKVLITTVLSAVVGLIGTLIGKIISKHKNSKIYKYAKTCVEAAEQKFPNEGKKMGPEKMAYVMDQLAIKFPKIKENSYLYNIAEAAVYQLNKEKVREEAIKEFEEKYGEKPLAALEDEKCDCGEELNNNIENEEKFESDEKPITKEKFTLKEKILQKLKNQSLEVVDNSTSSVEVDTINDSDKSQQQSTAPAKTKIQIF